MSETKSETATERFAMMRHGDCDKYSILDAEGKIIIPAMSYEHARMFCAAPELLEACKAVAQQLRYPWHKAQFGEVLQQLDAAIAKAQGGAA